MTSLEGCSYHKNLWIVGVPEKLDQGNLITFISLLLKNVLALPPDCILELEGAHQSLGTPLQVPACPYAFIVNFLCFATRDHEEVS